MLVEFFYKIFRLNFNLSPSSIVKLRNIVDNDFFGAIGNVYKFVDITETTTSKFVNNIVAVHANNLEPRNLTKGPYVYGLSTTSGDYPLALVSFSPSRVVTTDAGDVIYAERAPVVAYDHPQNDGFFYNPQDRTLVSIAAAYAAFLWRLVNDRLDITRIVTNDEFTVREDKLIKLLRR